MSKTQKKVSSLIDKKIIIIHEVIFKNFYKEGLVMARKTLSMVEMVMTKSVFIAEIGIVI